MFAEGPRCMFCLKGKYYRVNGECIKCPQSLYAILIGMGGVLVAAAAFAYWMNKKKISIALVAIGVDYAQVLSMFAKTRIRWPAYLKEIFSILSGELSSVVVDLCMDDELGVDFMLVLYELL